LTPAAVEKIKELQRRRGNPNVGLRLLVSGGGCSGFQYEFEICDGEEGNGGKADEGEKGAKDEEETVVEVDGARLFCDGMSLSFVKGSTIDYETDMIQSKFVVSENPNAELGCGCGSSFSVAM
jgi:iron-sulfur cluster assembly accessory protein